MIPIEQALQLIHDTVQVAEMETVALESSVGRVLSESVRTDIDSPPHDKSVMDGFAVIASDVSPGNSLKVIETVTAGAVPTRELVSGTATRIMTGAPIPKGSDAVVMVEKTEFDETKQTVSIQLESLASGQHVMARASAMASGDEIFPTGHTIRPQDIGLLAESGAAHVQVYRQPSIAVLPTGNELVDCDQVPGPGMIRNSNGPMLLSLARAVSGRVTDLGIGRDDREKLKERVVTGLENDFLILSGGVSAGTLDLVPEVLAEQGVTQVFHKVAIKPGKPIWFGVREKNGRSQYVFGLPGNPVSSLVGFNLFVRAALSVFTGHDVQQANRISPAILGKDHHVRGNRVTYWPVSLTRADDQSIATPIDWKGSSDMRALGMADGLGIFMPGEDGTFSAGEKIQVMNLI